MLISKKYLTEVVGWFEHIEQLADDRKTLNGDIMSDADTLDEIKALSKRSAKFIKKHYLSESKTTVKPRNSAKVKTQGLHKRLGYDR